MSSSDKDLLEAARDAFVARDWRSAFDSFPAVDDDGRLGGADLDAWAESAWWVGEIDDALHLWERAYDKYLADGAPAEAAIAAMFLACHSFERGDRVTGSGWRRRSERLLRDLPECAAHGYPLYFRVFELTGAGDVAGALDVSTQIRAIGERCGDANLTALGTLGEGRALVKRGDVEAGMGRLDEAMLSALSEELHPVWTGAIYCHLMDACRELDDVRRAGEWTRMASDWCDGLPPEALYRGICRVHRAQALRVRGDWREAEQEALTACENVAHLHVGTVAEGHYEVGEIRRQRGDHDGAEAAYRRAHELGREPQPGLALLRLATSDATGAATTIATALELEPDDRLVRAPLCAAQVEIALADEDADTAQRACVELEQTAAEYGSSGLEAAALAARGAVTLHGGEPGEAAVTLRAACRRWQELDAAHTAATVRLRLAKAYRRLGDEDAAKLELDAARAVFERLGASPDIERVAAMTDSAPRPGGLTEREVQVLRHVADGHTNREVAAMLFISERTVDRHLSNIFTKLDVTSRTAAAVFAHEHGLISLRG